MKQMVKGLLGRAGEVMPASAFTALNRAVDMIGTGRWIRANGFRGFARHDCRERLYEIILSEAADKRVLYLEFGVFEGAATKWWAERLKHPDTRLIGFDTFDGLPETWNDDYQKGHFSVGGDLPRIDDSRVSFERGLFSDTLPHVTLPEHDLLVLNLDADLYSSTKYVLDTLVDRIPVGSYLYFDEFNDADHELRALNEFMKETGWRFELLGVTNTLKHAVFRRIG